MNSLCVRNACLNRNMEDHQRKIDLQSPGDLTYLIANINKAAQEKLDLHLPPSAAQGKEDQFRLKVEELVREVSAKCAPKPSLARH